MEHTEKYGENNGLISSLLKIFSMFELRLNHYEEGLDVIYIRCINCKRKTGLYFKNTTFNEMIIKFVLNAILNHVSIFNSRVPKTVRYGTSLHRICPKLLIDSSPIRLD